MQTEQLLMLLAAVLCAFGALITIVGTRLLHLDRNQSISHARKRLDGDLSLRITLNNDTTDRLGGSTQFLGPKLNGEDNVALFPSDRFERGLSNWEDEGGHIAWTILQRSQA